MAKIGISTDTQPLEIKPIMDKVCGGWEDGPIGEVYTISASAEKLDVRIYMDRDEARRLAFFIMDMLSKRPPIE